MLKYVPLLETQFCARKRSVGSSWRLDETYVKVKGVWKYLLQSGRQGRRHSGLPTDRQTGLQSRASFFAHGDKISRVRGLRGLWVSGGEAEGGHFVGVLSFGDEFREDGALGVFKRNSGRLWRSAMATTSSEGGMPGRMVRSQEPKEFQTSRG